MAGVGVAGTLAASVFGLAWNRKREDARWELERQAERERWDHEAERERERWRLERERRELERNAERERWQLEREVETQRRKWERERDDRQHWLDERREVYADYLRASKAYTDRLIRCLTYFIPHGYAQMERPSAQDIDPLRDETDRIYELVTLIASPEVATCAAEVSTIQDMARMYLVYLSGDDEDGGGSPNASKHLRALIPVIIRLRSAMRVDLGMEPMKEV